jgi:hypothetical protein
LLTLDVLGVVADDGDGDGVGAVLLRASFCQK